MHDSDGEGTSSTVKVFGNIFISFIGAGVLGLPYAFKEAGILEGVTIMVLVGCLSIYAMLLIIDCKYEILENKTRKSFEVEEEAMIPNGEGNIAKNSKQKSKSSMTYGEVGFEAIGSKGALLVDIAILVSQVGFCCAYLIFITENIARFFIETDDQESMTAELEAVKIKKISLFSIIVPLCLLCFLRQLHRLAIFSLFADLANVFAYTIVFWFDFEHANKVRMHPKEIDLSGLPFFAGIAIYCYEGAGMILSLEESLVEDRRKEFRNIFKYTMLIITTLYILFGVCGYMSFGPETNAIITLNLPNGVFPFLVRGCLCFSLFFTFPVMMFPIIQILEKRLKMEYSSWMKGNALRSGMVLLCMFIVLLIPSFSTLMSLVGATCCNLLAFILPAVFHLKIFGNSITKRQRIIDMILIGLGLIGTIIGSIDSLKRLGIIHTASNVTLIT